MGFSTITARSLSREVNWGLDGKLVKGRDMLRSHLLETDSFWLPLCLLLSAVLGGGVW